MPNNKNIDDSTYDQELFSFTVAFMLCFMALLNCVNALTNHIGLANYIDTVTFYSIMVILVLFSLFRIVANYSLHHDVVAITLFMVIYYLFTMIVYPVNAEFMFTSFIDYSANPMYILFVYSFPAYIVMRYITDYEKLYRYLLIFSYVSVSLSVAVYFGARGSFASQYMTLSYNMLFQVVLLAVAKPKKHRMLHYIVLIPGTFIVLFGGARGALVSYLVCIIIYMFWGKRNSALKFIYAVLLGVLIYLMYIFYDDIILWLYRVLSDVGIESRTLRLLLTPTKDISSGRIETFAIMRENITLFGRGFFGDKAFNGTFYAHNLFLEWLFDFGGVFGTAIIVVYVRLLLKAFAHKKAPCWNLVIILLSTGFIKLLFSGSYLHHEPSFYALLGLCVCSANMREKAKKKKSKYLK